MRCDKKEFKQMFELLVTIVNYEQMSYLTFVNSKTNLLLL